MDLFAKMNWLILTTLVHLAISKPTSQTGAKTEMLEMFDLSQNNYSLNSSLTDSPRNNDTLENYTMIQNNQIIMTLPNGFFANMTRLKNLKLTKVGLSRVPEDLIWGSTKIEVLYMDKNYLQSITLDFFRDCKHLKKLILKDNIITHLPDNVFSTLENLEILDLSANDITAISENLLNGLFSLRIIRMEHNRLTKIDPIAFQSLHSLQVAHFSYNNLTLQPSILAPYNMSIPYSPFYLCKDTLEELYVDHNNITEVFFDWTQAHRLRTLNLAHNKLSSLSLLVIGALIAEDSVLSKKIEMDMTHNEIHSIYFRDIEMLLETKEIPHKIVINLQDNPINCDCDLYDFLKLIEGQFSPNVQNLFSLNVDNLKCHQPEKLKGIKITNLKSESLKCEIESSRNDSLCPNNCKCWKRSSTIFTDCSYLELITESESLFNIISDNMFSRIFIYIYVGFIILVGISLSLNYQPKSQFDIENELDKSKPRDAFISFSQKAEEFIVKELAPKLQEGPNPFELHVHYSKLKAGESFQFKLQAI